MSRRRWSRAIQHLSLVILVVVVGYRLHLDFFDVELESVHADHVETIQERVAEADTFRFAVVGNANNSIGVFERRIVPMLNASGAEFVVSAGNAVSDGGEDKYRALRGTLDRLEVPYLLTFAENEASRFGAFRFYRQFGPYFFAFTAGDTRFLFLDGAGETSPEWQLRWLEEELAREEAERTFLFTGRPLRRPAREPVFVDEEDYLAPPSFRSGLLELVERHDVDAVFASGLPLFDHHEWNGTRFVTTGGAGGLVVADEASFHHFTMVTVSEDDLSIQARRLDVGQHPVARTLESLWLFVHSLFFVGYLNFLLLLSALVFVAVKLHRLVFEEKDYYPSFDVDPDAFLGRPLRVAMFTNNYLPFIGGVPISIERLRRGLAALGHEVLVVAPGQGGADASDEESVLRLPSVAFGKGSDFRLANIFSPRVFREVKSFRPDVVHVHHPFWVGSLGLWLARRLGVPAVYTYHTRFEHYAHFVPVPGRLFKNLISHYLIKRFANRCSGVVVPTPSAREYLRTLGVTTRILVQPTGIEHRAFRDVDAEAVDALRRRLDLDDEPVLVSASRVSREKNIDFLIEAVGDLARRGARFRFVLIGDGPDRARLQARIAELGLEDVVLMPGAVPSEEMPRYYALGDVFLFASTTETQGMVVLEAMAAGLPVVVVRSSGIDDLVHDGFNGFKTREDIGQWIARVEEVLGDDALRRELARNAQSFAEEHGIEPFAEEVVRFYAAVLAASGNEPGEARAGATE
ncbi:MAG: glycosyltransferase family 4 protein [Gemmatimonadota bacterium]|nr:glycosyltransferase family 4 protein [Gemmatimonadota bacterium]